MMVMVMVVVAWPQDPGASRPIVSVLAVPSPAVVMMMVVVVMMMPGVLRRDQPGRLRGGLRVGQPQLLQGIGDGFQQLSI